MAAMKIQDGALVTSQLKYDISNRFTLRHLISGVGFMSISFIVFNKRRGGGGAFDAPTPPPPPVQGRPKRPSLNRVNVVVDAMFGQNLIFLIIFH